jgi:hypothetical protein
MKKRNKPAKVREGRLRIFDFGFLISDGGFQRAEGGFLILTYLYYRILWAGSIAAEMMNGANATTAL